MLKRNFIQSVGNTPLIYLDSLSRKTGCEIYGKAEFMNPGGSVKDRAALGMIEDAEARGLLKKGGTIIEATAGNTGIGLALIGNIKGYKVKLFVPSNQSKEKVDTLRGMGAEVILIPPAPYPSPENYRIIAGEVAKREGAFFINQFENESNYLSHYRTTGPEIWEQTDHQVTGFACAIGSGGTLAGVSLFLKEKNSEIQIGCVDPAGSAMNNYFNRGVAEVSPGDSITEGIGQGAVTANVRPCRVDQCHQLGDEVIVNMVHYIVKQEGIFLGSSSGANLCAAYLLAKKMGPGNQIVTILCDSGQKYVSKIYNSEFLSSRNLTITGDESSVFPILDARV
ncbi:MAG: cysteine synthase A [Bdellovibrionales bacterium]|nr:cysteine synthase A [Bdellovibrionales bacterium]